MKKFGAVVLAILVLAGFAYYMLILQMSDPDRSLYSIDLDEVRTLAGSVEGALPVSINTEAPFSLEFPGAAVVTGQSWGLTSIPVYAYQVVYSQGHLMIDSAVTTAQAADMGASGAADDDGSNDRLVQALGSAQHIVFTHEHADHIGGAVEHPQALELLDNVRLTDRQLSDLEVWGGITYPQGALDA